MQKKIQLTIPKPCHEQWDNFTPSGQGRFCGSCQKEVIDFTGWSEERLKDYFKKPASTTCGRFTEEQLKVYNYEQTRSSVRQWLPVALTGMIVLASREGLAQATKPATEQTQPTYKIGKVVSAPQVSTVVVRGTITDEEGALMPGVNVKRKGTSEGTVSDEFGKFMISLKNLKASDTLTFDFIGMNTFSYTVLPNQLQAEISVVMKFDVVALTQRVVMGGICFRRPWYSPRRWWLGIKSLF
jgi:hypothetical protein